jgi:adenosylcobinamide-GDP ribazoletransferase
MSTGWPARVAAGLEGAVSFLTPIGRGSGPVPGPGTMSYFPLVGAATGAVLGRLWHDGGRRLGPLAAASVVVAADAVLTGALHLDGLADSADGLLAHVPRQRRLDIMAAPEIGAFGATTLCLNLLLRTSALSALRPSPAFLTSLYASSRSLMVLASRALPYARPGGGLASAFLAPPPPTGGGGTPALVAAGTIAAALAGERLRAGRGGATPLATGLAAGAGVLLLARRRLGGFTGDVLGAAAVVTETVAALAAVAAGGAAGAAAGGRDGGRPPGPVKRAARAGPTGPQGWRP